MKSHLEQPMNQWGITKKFKNQQVSFKQNIKYREIIWIIFYFIYICSRDACMLLFIVCVYIDLSKQINGMSQSVTTHYLTWWDDPLSWWVKKNIDPTQLFGGTKRISSTHKSDLFWQLLYTSNSYNKASYWFFFYFW